MGEMHVVITVNVVTESLLQTTLICCLYSIDGTQFSRSREHEYTAKQLLTNLIVVQFRSSNRYLTQGMHSK